MGVCARDETNADRAADGLGHLALVDGSEAGFADVLDAAHLGHVLGHHAEVLLQEKDVS